MISFPFADKVNAFSAPAQIDSGEKKVPERSEKNIASSDDANEKTEQRN